MRGPLFWFDGDPELAGPPVRVSDGVVVCRDGRIVASGSWTELYQRIPADTVVHRYPGHVITAGFVDAHAHYPQTTVMGRRADGVTDWLNRYAYAEEARFASPEYAATVAETFRDELLRNGTTTALVFATSHPASVDAMFAAAADRDMRIVAGKVLMDRAAPAELLDTAERGYRESAALIDRWHGRGRAGYAITPRFAPACSPAALAAAATLRREHPDVLVHTHIAETESEIAQVHELFPQRDGYFDVYHHHGLTGPGTVLAHAVHLTEDEWAACRDTGTAIAHCPTSNLFLGSGLFDLRTATAHAVPVGLGTDVGAGTSFSPLVAAGAAYQVARLRGWAPDPLRLWYLATRGGARALRLDDRVGSLAEGHEADLVVLDPKATPALARRTDRAECLADLLFALAVLGDDRAVRATYVAGQRVHHRLP